MPRTRLNYHRWTAADDAILRNEYGKATAAEIAARIGCSARAAYQRANALGLASARKNVTRNAELRWYVRRKHRDGWLDTEIAAKWSKCTPNLPVDRRTICDVRRSMGLRSNASNDRHRDQVRQRTREQLAAAGLPTLAEVRAEAYRKFARDRGWPDYLRPRHVQILDLLYERGPHTREQIAKAINWNTSRNQRSWLSNKYGRGSYLSDLMAAGFVVRSAKRANRGPRKGTSTYVYFVSINVTRNRPDTWPEREWAHGQIYRAKQINDPAGSTAIAPDA